MSSNMTPLNLSHPEESGLLAVRYGTEGTSSFSLQCLPLQIFVLLLRLRDSGEEFITVLLQIE
jgi:hypothetical protein